MDTIIGYVTGFLCLIIAIILASGNDPAGVLDFIDGPSVFVTVGCTFCAMLIAHPGSQVKGFVGLIMKAVKYPLDDPASLIERLVKYAELARKNGILALDGATDPNDDPFMAKGIQLAVDGIDPDQIRETMETELEYLQLRHAQGKTVLSNFAKYAPAFGMIGTLIGLVAMLKTLSDPSSIGPKMAVALITTFYGAVMANLIFMPAADKLGIRDGQEKMNKEIIINGVLAIQSGDNPRMVEQKLMIYLPPSLRKEEA